MPALDTSDNNMKNALSEWPETQGLIDVLILEGFVRRVVATIDSLTGPKVALRVMPVKRVPGTFVFNDSAGSLTIAAENAARYDKYVKLAEAIDSNKLAAFYFRYYPLFQQAYRELGYPKSHFNDRLIAVIDHLLESPEPESPVALVRPKVFYQYADATLESRSSGQKILMRMGTNNARRIKARLAEIRTAVTRTSILSVR